MRGLIEGAPTPIRWLVVDAGAITNVDYSAARVIQTLQTDLARGGVVLVLVHAQSSLLDDLRRHRLTDVIGANHIFETLHEAVATMREQRVAVGPKKDTPQQTAGIDKTP